MTIFDDQGSDAPVVPTDDFPDDLEARVERMERELAAAHRHIDDLERYVADLEADPYRTPPSSGILQYDLASVAAHEQQAWEGAVRGWERTTGQSYDNTPPDKIGV